MDAILLADNRNSFLYRFLISPRLRVARHATAGVALIVIASNLILFNYQDSIEALGSWIYLLIFNLFVLYASLFYFNLLYLVPRYLLKQRYPAYILYLSAALAGAFMLQATQEHLVARHFGMGGIFVGYPTVAIVLDYLSSFPLTLLAIIGGSMTVLLRLWIVENHRVTQLEKLRLQSEIEQLKEQISPSMLFRVLHHAGLLAPANPAKASKMLMKLSQILRYQLYDCNREKVLLSTEIKFLNNYLELEQLVSGKFDYQLDARGETSRTFIPPLLFIPFIQYAVERMEAQAEDEAGSLQVVVEVKEACIVFSCHTSAPCLTPQEELNKIRQRLDLQYGECHQLTLDDRHITLQLEGGEL